MVSSVCVCVWVENPFRRDDGLDNAGETHPLQRFVEGKVTEHAVSPGEAAVCLFQTPLT